MKTKTTEVCVIGGGPAGSILALRLARLGHGVCLVAASARPRAYGRVSLSPAVSRLLETLEISLNPEEEIGDRRILWELPHRYDVSSRAALQLVERDFLDRTLQKHARAAGARILPGTANPPMRAESGWRIGVMSGGARTSLGARFLVDAAGRRGILPGRPRAIGLRTLALTAESPTFRGPGFHHVESCGDGWLWAAGAAADGRMVVAAFVDPKQWNAGVSPAEQFSEFLQRTLLCQKLGISPAAFASVSACDASAACHPEVIGEDWIRVGDAALALDPIAGQGVQGAISGALQAATVIHTLLKYPADAAAAEQFYRARHDERCQHHDEQIARLYSSAYRSGHGGSFWQQRARPFAPQPDPPDVVPFHVDLRLHVSPEIEWEQVPCAHQDRVRSFPALVIADAQRPVAFLGGRALHELLRRLAPGGAVPELVVRLEQLGLSRSVSLETVQWLYQKRLLLPDGKSFQPGKSPG